MVQLARSDNTVILATSLRVVANVFDTMRQHLKLQQELFISYLLDRLERPSIADSYDAEASPPVSQHLAPSTPIPGREGSPAPSLRRETPLLQSEARDLLLEHLAQSSRAQDYLINLWINYDCSMDCGDLCERVLGFFSRVYPSLISIVQKLSREHRAYILRPPIRSTHKNLPNYFRWIPYFGLLIIYQ